jgi:hypothetical protein
MISPGDTCVEYWLFTIVIPPLAEVVQVKVGVKEGVPVGVLLGVRVMVGVGVAVRIGVCVGVEVTVLVTVPMGVGVMVRLAPWIGVFENVQVGVMLGVRVMVIVGVPEQTTRAPTAFEYRVTPFARRFAVLLTPPPHITVSTAAQKVTLPVYPVTGPGIVQLKFCPVWLNVHELEVANCPWYATPSERLSDITMFGETYPGGAEKYN